MGPPGAAQPPSAGGSPEQMKMSFAMADALIGSGIGAATGVGSSLYAGHKAPEAAQEVQKLEKKQDGSFLQASRLAAAKQKAMAYQLASDHPVGSAVVGGLGGALSGALAGPRLMGAAREIAEVAPDAARGFARGMRGQ